MHASSPVVCGAGQEERRILVARSLPLQNHLCDNEAKGRAGQSSHPLAWGERVGGWCSALHRAPHTCSSPLPALWHQEKPKEVFQFSVAEINALSSDIEYSVQQDKGSTFTQDKAVAIDDKDKHSAEDISY